MTQQEAQRIVQPKLRTQFRTHVGAMPTWQKDFLGLAVVAALAGAGGYAYAHYQGDWNSLAGSISPRMMRIGTSVVVGFILGWLLRAALKLAMSVVFFIVLVVGALSFFDVINFDLWKVKETAETSGAWVKTQSDKAIDLAKNYLPSAGGAAFGVFMGFRRKY